MIVLRPADALVVPGVLADPAGRVAVIDKLAVLDRMGVLDERAATGPAVGRMCWCVRRDSPAALDELTACLYSGMNSLRGGCSVWKAYGPSVRGASSVSWSSISPARYRIIAANCGRSR